MLLTAILLFTFAAAFGAIILFAILRNKPTPKPAVFIHGGLAAIALLLVLLFSATHPSHIPIVSLTLFIITALGGLTLFVRDMLGKPLPKWLAVLHPLLAVAGLIFLILFAFAIG